MKEMTGEQYDLQQQWAKMAAMAGNKEGKTCFLVGSALGVWPGQAEGGIISDPANLHIISVDVVAMKNCLKFLVEKCGAPAEVMKKVRIYNMEDDARKVYAGEREWDYSFYNSLLNTFRLIHSRASNGVHLMVVSSITGVGQAIKRGIAGPPGQPDKGGNPKKGAGMDMAKWDALGSQIAEIRNLGQLDGIHCIWEAHLHKTVEGKGEEMQDKDSILLQGSVGKNFAMNVGEPFRLRMIPGAKYKENQSVNQMVIETRPSLSFLTNARGFAQLADRETDLTAVFRKLGYKTGGWGAGRRKPQPKQVQLQDDEE